MVSTHSSSIRTARSGSACCLKDRGKGSENWKTVFSGLSSPAGSMAASSAFTRCTLIETGAFGWAPWGTDCFAYAGILLSTTGGRKACRATSSTIYLKTGRASCGSRPRMASTASVIRAWSPSQHRRGLGKRERSVSWLGAMARSGLQTTALSRRSRMGRSRPFEEAMVFPVSKSRPCLKIGPGISGWGFMTVYSSSRMDVSSVFRNPISSRWGWYWALQRISMAISGPCARVCPGS